MNASEISPKANNRMTRIQKVSKQLRLILQYGIPLWFLFGTGLSVLMDYGIKIPLYSNPARAPYGHTNTNLILIHSCLLLVLFLFWYRTVIKLFGFFEKGILFTAETVRCIQLLGWIYILNFLLGMIFLLLLQNDQRVGADVSDLFTGFFIFFIGWLIDEARKIREEQELTV
jgi:hypothetical protein